MVMFGYRYGRSGAETGWDYPPTGTPGSRAPHVTLRQGDRELSVLDLFGPGFTVLCGATETDWPTAASMLDGQLSQGLAGYRIGSGPGEGDLWAPDGAWQAAYGVGPDGAVLVRPDGFIAWRCASAPADLRAALADAVHGALARDGSRAWAGAK